MKNRCFDKKILFILGKFCFYTNFVNSKYKQI